MCLNMPYFLYFSIVVILIDIIVVKAQAQKLWALTKKFSFLHLQPTTHPPVHLRLQKAKKAK